MPRARLETVLTGDDAPFIAAVNRAEKRAQTFSARVQGLFKRDPGQRAERAVSGFIADLSGGNVSGAITGLAGRITGLGLITGVAIGAAVETFQRFKGSIDETTKAQQLLRQELSKPLALQVELGAEGIAAQLATLEKAAKDFEEKRDSFGSKAKRLLSLGSFGPASGAVGRVEAADSEAAAQRIKDLATARADAELDIVRIKEISLTKSEAEGALYKLQLDTLAKIAKLQIDQGLTKPGRDQVDLFKQQAAIQQNAKLIGDAIKDQADQKERELSLDAQLLQAEVEGASIADRKLATLKGTLAIIQEELRNTRLLTDNARTGLEIAERRAKLNIAKEEFKQRFDPGEGGIFQTPEQKESASFNKFMRDRSQYGEKSRHLDLSGDEIDPAGRSTLEQSYARSSDAYNGPQDRDFSRTGQPYATPTFQSQLGNLDKQMAGPTHMAPLGHMDRFGKKGSEDEGGAKADEGDSKDQPVVAAVNDLKSTVEKIWAA